MKCIFFYIFIGWFSFGVEIYAQTWPEKMDKVVLEEMPDSLCDFLLANPYIPIIDEKNDTVKQISGVFYSLSKAYKNNKLGGQGDNAEAVAGFKLVIIQSDVVICFLDNLDYRSVISQKYGVKEDVKRKQQTESFNGLVGDFPFVYQEIPGIKTIYVYKFYNEVYEYALRLNRPSFRPFVMLDKTQLLSLRKSLSKHKKRIDWEKMKNVLDVSLSEKGRKVSLSYSFWVDKLIFNKDRDVCIAQFSTRNASYEALLMRLEDSDEWKIIRNTEMYYRKCTR